MKLTTKQIILIGLSISLVSYIFDIVFNLDRAPSWIVFFILLFGTYGVIYVGSERTKTRTLVRQQGILLDKDTYKYIKKLAEDTPDLDIATAIRRAMELHIYLKAKHDTGNKFFVGKSPEEITGEVILDF